MHSGIAGSDYCSNISGGYVKCCTTVIIIISIFYSYHQSLIGKDTTFIPSAVEQEFLTGALNQDHRNLMKTKVLNRSSQSYLAIHNWSHWNDIYQDFEDVPQPARFKICTETLIDVDKEVYQTDQINITLVLTPYGWRIYSVSGCDN